MASIGGIKIKKLKEIVRREAPAFAPLSMNSYQLSEHVKSLVEPWEDIHECAWSEIQRIVDDEINQIKYGKG